MQGDIVRSAQERSMSMTSAKERETYQAQGRGKGVFDGTRKDFKKIRNKTEVVLKQGGDTGELWREYNASKGRAVKDEDLLYCRKKKGPAVTSSSMGREYLNSDERGRKEGSRVN